MAAILLMLGTIVLAVVGGLFGTDTRDSADWSRPMNNLSSHNR